MPAEQYGYDTPTARARFGYNTDVLNVRCPSRFRWRYESVVIARFIPFSHHLFAVKKQSHIQYDIPVPEIPFLPGSCINEQRHKSIVRQNYAAAHIISLSRKILFPRESVLFRMQTEGIRSRIWYGSGKPPFYEFPCT